MAPIYRIRVIWTGFPGAPGYTNLYFTSPDASGVGQAASTLVETWWTSMTALFPGAFSFAVDPAVPVMEDSTGEITDYEAVEAWSVTGTGGSTMTYAGASGACVDWITAHVVAGRILRGRTFLVPIGNTSYQTDGTLTPATISTISTGAAALYSSGAPDLSVWHRPTSKGAADGEAWPVQSHRIPDLATVLRSRRD